MTKEVTITVCKVAKIEVVNGLPSVVMLPNLELLGNVSEINCTKAVQKEHGQTASIYEYGTYTQTYKMKVTDFIKTATLVTNDDNVDEEEDENNIGDGQE